MNKANINIKTSGLTKYYGSSRGLIDLDLKVGKGEIFGFLGPNGAGKTTTIRLLLGLIKPSKGEMEVLGKKIYYGSRNIFRDIGYIPGEMNLYRDLTGYQIFAYFMKLRKKWNDEDSKKRLSRLMDRFDIDYHKRIKSCSKGMKQMIGIIQAFMHKPKLLILDEPTSGLDPMMQEIFYDLIFEEKDKGNTIFFSSHILSEVERVCDRVAIIKKGKLVHVEDFKDSDAIVGKKIILKISSEDIPENIKNLKGVKELSRDKNRIEFFYSGEVSALIKNLACLKIIDFICETPSIEDVFFKFYKD
ncbi:MAG: ABC transporter ATP-binding protein [candidate division WOR-3 bacterium]